MIAEAAVSVMALLFAAQPDGKAALTDLEVTVEGRQISVSFELEDAFNDELVARIQSGLPTQLDFRLKLAEDRQRWFDRALDKTDLQVVATYDAVTREYLVNFKQDGELTESRVLRDLSELETAMTRFESVPAFTVGELPARRRLLVRARAVLGSKNFLFLIPTEVETDWLESRKFRLP